MPIICTCKYCGKTFKKYPYDIKNGRGKYCCRKCMRKDIAERRGNFHPVLRFRGIIDEKDLWWKGSVE